MFGDNPEHFDLIYIGALGLSCVFCWADKDTLGALVILLVLWCLSRMLYIFGEVEFVLAITYPLSLFILGYYIDKNISKITLLITLFSIGVELFWWVTSYENKPTIHYYVGFLALTILSRELLLQKVFLLNNYFGLCSGKIALDWHLRHILFISYIFFLMMLTEYFIRHLAGFKQVTYVYYQFTLVGNILSGIILAVIYMHFFYNQSQKHIHA